MTNLYRLNEVLHRLINKKKKTKTKATKKKMYSKLVIHLHYNLIRFIKTRVM